MPRLLAVKLLILALGMSALPASLAADELSFRAEELKTRLSVGYAVRLLDVNEDGKLDIVVVDSKRILWLENPTWAEHVMHEDPSQKFDNVCFAPYDINGDGRLDFAVGTDWQPGNTKSGGVIGWLEQPEKPAELWRFREIGQEPTVHRMQWADFDGDGRAELIVVPLKGRDTTDPHFMENGVRILSYDIPKNPAAGPWEPKVISDKLHVAHNFEPVDVSGDKKLDLLVASFEGVTLFERGEDGAWTSSHIGEGNQATKPNRGASEIKLGRLGSGSPYIGTIEPWHGHQVVVYSFPKNRRADAYRTPWTRTVLDEDLLWGHAVWCANLDDDADEELIIGVRDHKSNTARSGVRIYDPQHDGSWQRTLVDPGGVNVEDLAAADLNGDGKIDVVAVGRQSKNVKIYWNETK